MGTGILICGLNGSGKTTLGRLLANKLGFYFIDNEDVFFPKTTLGNTFQSIKPYSEAVLQLKQLVRAHPNFIFTAIKGDYGKDILPFYKHIIVIEVPKEIRLKRIRARSFEKFGNRMLYGGDLYESEESFFNMVNHREDHYVEDWLKSLNCPIIRIDGTKPIDENIDYIIKTLL